MAAPKIFSNMDAGVPGFQQFDLLLPFACAVDDAHGGVLPRLAFVFVQPAKMQLLMSFVFGTEFVQFEFNCNQAAQATMEERQVDMEVILVHCNSLLTVDKGKFCTQFQYEGLCPPV